MNKILPLFSSITARLLNPILKKYDYNKIKNSKKDYKYYPIYIVGAPRTGSTLLFQYITNYFNVLYTDNIINQFYRTFYLAFSISNLFYKNKPHNCFTSIHGRTYHCGMHGPSECSGFWYRWFPKKTHHLESNDIDKKDIDEIRNNILSVSTKYKKHLVFKNLNNGQRLQILKEIHQDSKIIFIKREPIYTVQSILKARKQDKIKEGKIWSVKPKNYIELEKMSEIKMVVNQVYEIEKEITEQLKLFSKDQIIILNYKDFCQRPKEFMNKLEKNIFKAKISKRIDESKLNKITFNEKITMNNLVKNEVTKQINLLAWK